jgi:hypothetical protein
VSICRRAAHRPETRIMNTATWLQSMKRSCSQEQPWITKYQKLACFSDITDLFKKCLYAARRVVGHSHCHWNCVVSQHANRQRSCQLGQPRDCIRIAKFSPMRYNANLKASRFMPLFNGAPIIVADYEGSCKALVQRSHIVVASHLF